MPISVNASGSSQQLVLPTSRPATAKARQTYADQTLPNIADTLFDDKAKTATSNLSSRTVTPIPTGSSRSLTPLSAISSLSDEFEIEGAEMTGGPSVELILPFNDRVRTSHKKPYIQLTDQLIKELWNKTLTSVEGKTSFQQVLTNEKNSRENSHPKFADTNDYVMRLAEIKINEQPILDIIKHLKDEDLKHAVKRVNDLAYTSKSPRG